MVFEGIKNITEKIMGTKRVSYEEEMNTDGDYVEVVPNKNNSSSKVLIKYFIINDFSDIKPILDLVRDGRSVIFANIKQLRSKDITELKRMLSKIKKTCEAVGGDIIGLDENFILIYPEYAEVSKEDFE